MAELELIFFDVGLGECIFASSGGKTLLIDGGSWYCDSLRLYLKEHGISRIDEVVCTHAHEDHVDGLGELAEFVSFGHVYSNMNEFVNSSGFTKLKAHVEKSGGHIEVPSAGDRIEFGSCWVTFLSPGDCTLYKTGNDRSLTCLLTCGVKRILMTADIGSAVMQRWMESGLDIKADLLKIPHHGIENIHTDFLDAVHPKAAVVSFAKNDYAPLSKALLKKLKGKDIDIFRTDAGGDICCRIQDGQLEMSYIDYRSRMKGKKLLVLAANEESKVFVKKAQALGIYVVVTDHIKNSPAKAIADKSYDINGKNVEEVTRAALEEDIDGLIVGAADPLVVPYTEVAHRLQLPCYINENNRDFFINKKYFKDMCRQSGIHTVKEYFTGGDWDAMDSDRIQYPCIVKPVFGRGGKGVFLCKDFRELGQAFRKAKECSDNGRVIIEAYMDCEDISVNYFFRSGVAYLIGVSDRKTVKGKSAISPVTYENIYPSMLTGLFIEQCHEKFLNLFKKLKIRNGILEMQTFWDGKNFYPYDPACILGGELSGPVFSQVLGIDLVECFLTYALTGNMGCFHVPSDGGVIPGGGCAQSIWILLKPGVVNRIEGISGIEGLAGVLGCLQRLHEGDEISQDMFETEKSALARIWIKAPSFLELKKLAENIRGRIRVFDADGSDMVWEGEN